MIKHFVGWWNLENLFDVEDSKDRPPWLKKRLQKELEGWNSKILAEKINQLSKIISKMNDGRGPDILGVCEVENKPVVEQLVKSLNFVGRNYKVAHHDTSDGRGIDVAFIYDNDRFEFEQQFSHEVIKRAATRDLFQVNLVGKQSGENLIVVGNHWPSRMGGEYETEPFRIVAAETLSYWYKRIREEKGKDVAIVIMGDFNDEPHSRSITKYALGTNTMIELRKARSPKLFNLMWGLMGTGLGTHYMGSSHAMFDQFMISKGFLNENRHFKVKLDSAEIIRYPEMMSSNDYKGPIRFGRPYKGLNKNGFSDHFPISLELEEN